MCTDTVVVEDKTDSIFRIPILREPRAFPRYKKNIQLSF